MTVFDLSLNVLMLATAAGVVYLVVAVCAVRRFAALASVQPERRPPVTVLKPLCGEEPDLYDNLRSFCDRSWPGLQVVFGVRNSADPAIAVVERLKADLPDLDIALVVDSRVYGTNLKISNVINIMAKAKHDLLVLADSDMQVGPGYLDAVVGPLLNSSVGLVTCLYRGVPTTPEGSRGLWSELGAMFINHGFLAQVLVGRLVGANDGCFGATMALRRDVLDQVGGFEAFKDKLADDYALGAAVRALGLRVELSPHVIATGVNEPDLPGLVRHELRWARTLRSIEPAGFGASIITHPLLPATLVLIGSGFASYGVAIFAAVLAVRIVYNRVTDAALGLPASQPWLAPLRDLLSVSVLIASFCGSGVTWREQKFRVEPDGQMTLDGDIRP
ncbi:MAG: bacteriohopanetetrol glucosamine biosynthesis glycosyltransferase HpnI [Rhodospirillaceae bacterium]